MRFFGCDACDARKDEIEHLRVELTEKNKQIELLVKRLTELSDPGIDRRLRPPRPMGPLQGPVPVGGHPVPGRTLTNQPGSNLPGYERERTAGPPVSYEVE